ncbi:uncharacterized protein LOC129753693 [Uranotaenia lowii]|uniref:uncharacterized protein LOC129753693 n=1 Tax=Uranotaenia lowii TaxID=190385 RepID=UPI002478CE0A|nr:uncharacterized protein LOC129753693 [Uranotaenia lowii]
MEYDNSLEIYRINIALIRRLTRVVGADVLRPNYRPNIRTLRTLTFIIIYLGCSFYTFWYYSSDYIQILKTLAPLGMGLQGLYKLYNAVIQREFFIAHEHYLDQFHQKNKHHSRKKLITKRMVQTHTLNKLLLAAYAFAIAGFGLYPLYYYVVYREKALALAVLIPGIDWESNVGYAITVVFHFSLLALALTGITAADSAILVFIANLTTLVEVFKGSLQELNDLLEASKRDVRAIRQKTKEIFAEHYAIIRY